MTKIEMQKKKDQTFRDHLSELRRRLLYCLIFLAAGMVVGWVFNESLIKVIQHPLGQKLYYNDPVGGLNFVMSVSLFVGILAAVPVFMHQLMHFIRPASVKISAWLIIRYVIISTILAICGVSFAYFLSLPAALHFLMQIGPSSVSALISADKYFNFVMTYLASFALIFQLPLILLFINRITPMSGGKLLKLERPVIIISFIAAAILTPTPDLVNQLVMALPIIVLYQVAALCVMAQNKFKKSKTAVSHSRDAVSISTDTSLHYMPIKQDIHTAKSLFPTTKQKSASRLSLLDMSKSVSTPGKTINLSSIDVEIEKTTIVKPANQPIDLRKFNLSA